MNNVIFGKTMANLRKPRGIKLATTERRKNYQYQNQIIKLKNQIEYLLATEMKKLQILLNEPVYLGLSILELSKILINEIWYYYVLLSLYR